MSFPWLSCPADLSLPALPGCAVLTVLFSLSGSGAPVFFFIFNFTPVLAVLLYFSVLAVLFWLSCYSSLFFWLSCSGCPVPTVLIWLAVLFWLSCYSFLFWLSCSGCPVLTVLIWLAVLFWLPLSGCPDLAVLFPLSCSGCPAFYTDSVWEDHQYSADVGYRISKRFFLASDKMSDSAPSARYRWVRHRAQSDIAHRRYRTERPPLLISDNLNPS